MQTTEFRDSVAVQRCEPRTLFGRNAVGIKPAPPLGLPPRDIRPADLLGAGEDTRLNGLVFPWCGHGLRDAVVEIPHAHFFASREQHRSCHLLEAYHGSDLFRKRQRRELVAASFLCGKKAGDFRFQGVHCFHFPSRPWRWSTPTR